MRFYYSVTNLGTLGGDWSYAFSINEAGQVIGFSSTSNGTERAFRWDNGTIIALGTNPVWNNGMMADLSTLGGNKSIANGINKAGQVVGYFYTSTNSVSGFYHAFLADNGIMTDLGTLGGNYSKAYGINDGGMVFGESLTSSGACHAFLWNNGTMSDLNNLLSPNSGWVLNQALGINNKGQIVGGGTFHGQSRAFLLTPIHS